MFAAPGDIAGVPIRCLMPRSRRHHLVPQFYLRRWADERGRIAVFPVDGSRPYVTSVANAAVETDFYTIEGDDGQMLDDIEVAVMGAVEPEAADAMRRIDESLWPVDLEARTGLANFLALQLVRGWHFRDMTGSITEAMVRSVNRHLVQHPEAIQEALRHGGHSELSPEELARQVAWMADDSNFRVQQHPNASIRAMLETAAEMVEHFGLMSWWLATATTGSFITSDRPIALWHRMSHQLPVGLLNAQEVTLPLDPKKCLLMKWDFHSEIKWEATEEEVQTFNMLTAAMATKQIYAHPSALETGLEPFLGHPPT
jgi:hypothetical protein